MPNTIGIADEEPAAAGDDRMAMVATVAGALTPKLGSRMALECASSAVQGADGGLLADAVSRYIAHRRAHPSLFPEWQQLTTRAVLEMIAAVKTLDQARRKA